MKDHPKEEGIKNWLQANPNPTLKQIFAEFSPDLESVVMAATHAGMPVDMDLKVFCRGIPLEERILKYSAYPLWFKTFIPQDIEHAIAIYKINRDSDDYAKDIVEDWSEETDAYINLVKNASSFPNNSVNMTFKNVVLSNEENFDKNITEEFDERIQSGQNIEFEDDFEKQLFYFLKLNSFTDFAQSDLNEFNNFADKYSEEYLIRDVFGKAVIGDNYIYIHSTQPISLYFDVEPKIDIDPQSLSKDVLKELKGLGMDYVEEGVESLLAELVAGRTLTIAKLLYKIAKATKSTLDDNLSITFDDSDEVAFYDNFVNAHVSHNKSLKDVYLQETKLPTEKLFIKKRMDMSVLGSNFFENQYRIFVNTRVYGKAHQLPEKVRNKILAIKEEERRETELFVALFKLKKQVLETEIEIS